MLIAAIAAAQARTRAHSHTRTHTHAQTFCVASKHWSLEGRQIKNTHTGPHLDDSHTSGKLGNTFTELLCVIHTVSGGQLLCVGGHVCACVCVCVCVCVYVCFCVRACV